MRGFFVLFFGFLFCEEAFSEKCALVIQNVEALTPSAAEIESRPKTSIGGVDATLHAQRRSGMRTVHDRPIVAF